MTIHLDNRRVSCCQEKSTVPDYHSVIWGERLPLRAKPSNLRYGAHGMRPMRADAVHPYVTEIAIPRPAGLRSCDDESDGFAFINATQPARRPVAAGQWTWPGRAAGPSPFYKFFGECVSDNCADPPQLNGNTVP